MYLVGHIDSSRLKAFLLNQEKLTEEEERHLIRCKECTEAMAEATLTHLQNGSHAKESPSAR